MRKISILIALAMILTIGGVYATWNYAQGSAANIDLSPTVVLTDKVIDTPKGSIIVDMSSLNISIDDANHDYDAELVMSGAINITFVADALAPTEVQTNGIKLQYTVAATTPWEYNGTQIFTAVSTPIVINNGIATFTATITAEELMNVISMGNISLPTVDDYDAFETILSQGAITITIGEAQ